MTYYAMTASAGAAAIANIFRPGRSHPHRAELTAVGLNDTRVRTLTLALTGIFMIVIAALAGATLGWKTGIALTWAIGVWMPLALPNIIRNSNLNTGRIRREQSILSWMQRIRIYTAAGLPLAAAAVQAAEQVKDKQFRYVANNIREALLSGNDPLHAASRACAGSSAETLLNTITTMDQTGAASQTVIDKIIDRSITILNAKRAAQTEKIARGIQTATTLIALLVAALMLLAIMQTLPSL